MPSTDIDIINVVHPFTGESIDLTVATVDDLASFRIELKEYGYRLRDVNKYIDQEILRRMDKKASYTIRTPDYEMKGASPAPSEEWDELALRSDLYELVDRDVIDESAADAAVETVVTYKVRKVGVNALRKLGGIVQETVDRHCREVPKDRRVTVSGRPR